MKNLFRWKRGGLEIEAELRAARPQAPERLVRSIAATLDPRPSRVRSSRRSLGFVGALGVATLALLGATGGFSYAASGVADAVHATAHAAHISRAHPVATKASSAGHATSSSSLASSAACVQYGHAPTITKFAPATVVAGSRTVVTITGTNLQNADHDASVTAAGQPGTFKSAATSGKSFGFTVDASTHGSVGPVAIHTCSGDATSAGNITVVAKPNGIDFDSGVTGHAHDLEAGQSITVTGHGFIGVAKNGVLFGTKASADAAVTDDGNITVTVPTGVKATGTLNVKNAGGTGIGPSFAFSAVAPTVTGVTPTTAVAAGQNNAETQITIRGTNLTTDDEVVIGGADANVISAAADHKSMVVAAASGSDSGQSSVQVIDSVGGSATKLKAVTVIKNPHPTAGGPFIISDHSLFGAKKGGKITITGTHLTGAKLITFQGTSKNTATASSVTDTSFTVTVPSGAANGLITVANLAGSATLNTGFQILIDKPTTIAGPGSAARNQQITLTAAKGFLGVTAVKVGSVAVVAANIIVQDDQTLKITIPATAKLGTNQTITVTNPLGSGTVKMTITSGG